MKALKLVPKAVKKSAAQKRTVAEVKTWAAEALAEYFATRDILTTDNYKMRKDALEWLKVGLGLAPASDSGFQVCGDRSPGCEGGCLKFAGRNQGTHAGCARVMRTRLLFLAKKAFLATLKRRLSLAMARARKSLRKLAVRLNILSDIAWELIAPELFELVDQAYDYTKSFARMKRFLRGQFPGNYHLTFSRSETNEEHCMDVLAMGGNVAVVVRNDTVKARLLASGWNGFPCIDGDESDNRWLDPRQHVVLLRAKGAIMRRDEMGMVVD